MQALSLKAVGSLIVSLCPPILRQLKLVFQQAKIDRLHACVHFIREHLAAHVPHHLYDAVAIEVLSALKTLIERKKKMYDPLATITSFLTEMNVVVGLTEVVLSAHLKRLDFTAWPKIMRYVMCRSLEKLTGLEVLNLGACAGGWSTESGMEKVLVAGVAGMKNLRSLCLCFDCTDSIVAVLGDSCPGLQSLDVTSSRSVTDRSVAALLKCRKMRVLQLHRTSVSAEGYAELLTGLPNLHDLGRCDEFGKVVLCLSQTGCTLPLKRLQVREMSTTALSLLVHICPSLSQLSVFHNDNDNDTVCDLRLLSLLSELKELKLLSCRFYGDRLQSVVEARGGRLTSLHLEHVEDMDLNGLVLVSQCCPALKSLVLYNCDFADGSLPAYERRGVSVSKPFQRLERLFWVVDCAVAHLEFVLAHAVNLKYVHLGSSTGIVHESVVRVLAANRLRSLEEVRILFSSDMSMETVQMLLASCSNLRRLSELESWQGISLDELGQFRKFLSANNYDLDVRPMLSY